MAVDASKSKVMESLEYEHISLAEQLDQGLMELDVFYVADEAGFLIRATN